MLGRLLTMPVSRLAGYSAGGALFVLTVGYGMRFIKSGNFYHRPEYRQAIRLSKRHKGVRHILGMPVQEAVI